MSKVPLRDINVLIGANGSGKSNFLRCFRFCKLFMHAALAKDSKTKQFANMPHALVVLKDCCHFGS